MNDDPDNVANSKYYSMNQIQSCKIANNSKFFSIFHMNARSLNTTFDELEYFLKCTNKQFDVLAITETKFTRNTFKLCKICLKNYVFESTPTESSAGRTLHCKSLIL